MRLNEMLAKRLPCAKLDLACLLTESPEALGGGIPTWVSAPTIPACKGCAIQTIEMNNKASVSVAPLLPAG